MLSRLIDGCGKQCACYTRRGNACWMLRPKPGCTSASAVVIYVKRKKSLYQYLAENRRGWHSDFFHFSALAEMRLIQEDATTTERSSGFQGLGGGALNKLFAIRPGLHCLPLCLTLNRNLKPFPKKRKIQETDFLHCCYSRKMV